MQARRKVGSGATTMWWAMVCVAGLAAGLAGCASRTSGPGTDTSLDADPYDDEESTEAMDDMDPTARSNQPMNEAAAVSAKAEPEPAKKAEPAAIATAPTAVPAPAAPAAKAEPTAAAAESGSAAPEPSKAMPESVLHERPVRARVLASTAEGGLAEVRRRWIGAHQLVDRWRAVDQAGDYSGVLDFRTGPGASVTFSLDDGTAARVERFTQVSVARVVVAESPSAKEEAGRLVLTLLRGRVTVSPAGKPSEQESRSVLVKTPDGQVVVRGPLTVTYEPETGTRTAMAEPIATGKAAPREAARPTGAESPKGEKPKAESGKSPSTKP